MGRKVRIGIIGCGGIANGKHMPALKKIEEAEMVAFCDIIEERAVKAAKEFGVEGAKVYTDYRKLLEDESIESVHVCTPNRSHSFITIDALEAGKHVMCEKPMAKTYAEAKKMYETAQRTGKKLTIGYQQRWRPDSLYLKEACDNGDLGDIYYGRAIALRAKPRDIEANRPRRLRCELVPGGEDGVYFFEQHGTRDPLPESFSGWIACAPHDGVAHATTAHRTFCRMERTPEGGIRFPAAQLAAGGRCSVYAVDQTGAMRVAEVRLPKPRPAPEKSAPQVQAQPAD